jgi:predicted RNA-binding protein associated with RNAse of E/G family
VVAVAGILVVSVEAEAVEMDQLQILLQRGQLTPVAEAQGMETTQQVHKVVQV